MLSGERASSGACPFPEVRALEGSGEHESAPAPRKEYHGRETQGNQEEGTRMSILSQDVIDLINGPVTGVLGTAAPYASAPSPPSGRRQRLISSSRASTVRGCTFPPQGVR